MMRPILALAAITALAACQPAERATSEDEVGGDPSADSLPGSPEHPAPAEPTREEPRVRGLAGEYRVAGADGRDIDLPHGISASITSDRIDVTSGCVRFAWSYRFLASRLETERVPVEGCQRGLYPEEEAVAQAFDAAETVARTPASGIRLSGGGNSVTIFSQ